MSEGGPEVAVGGVGDADPSLAAMRKRVDLLSVWLFRRVPLAALVLLAAYMGLRLADSSGREQWRVAAPKDKPFLALTATPTGVYALRVDGVCTALSPLDGTPLWETRVCDSIEYDGRLVATNDLLLVTSPGGLWVLDASGGTVLFKQEETRIDEDRAMLLGRRLLFANDGWENLSWFRRRATAGTNHVEHAPTPEEPSLTCVDFASGRIAWKKSLPGRRITCLAGDGDRLVCASEVPSSWERKPCPKHENKIMAYGQECDKCVSRWIPASDRRIDAIDAASGAVKWHCLLKGGEVHRIRASAGRIAILTGQRVYTITTDGHELGRVKWASSNVTDTVLTPARTLGIEAGSTVRAAGATPSDPTWTFNADGYILDLAEDDATVFVSAMQQVAGGNRAGAMDVPAAQTQLTRELWGNGDEESFGAKSRRRVLLGLDARDGSVRWREFGLLGRILPCGDMFIRISEGSETVLIFPEGGTLLFGHLARNGKQIWSRKMPFMLHDMTLLSDRIVAIAGARGSGWHGSDGATSAVVSFKKRSLLNRIMKP